MVTTDIQNSSIDKLHAKQKKDIHCGYFTAQSHCKNKNNLNPVMISADGLLQIQQDVNGLKYYVTKALCSTLPVILCALNNSKGHQGTIFAFEAITKFYWWSKLHQDIVNYTNRCSVCTKNLSNMAK